jgi:hypothetical protein
MSYVAPLAAGLAHTYHMKLSSPQKTTEKQQWQFAMDFGGATPSLEKAWLTGKMESLIGEKIDHKILSFEGHHRNYFYKVQIL